MAIKIQVGAGIQISGQVLNDEAIAKAGGPKYRVIDGKRYLWVSARTGTNLAGKWVEEGSARDGTISAWSSSELQKKMDRGGEGSMLTSHASYNPTMKSGY